jgi:hypothetical protein
MMGQKRFRLYLDFCKGGDLWQALEDHFDFWAEGWNEEQEARTKRIEQEAKEKRTEQEPREAAWGATHFSYLNPFSRREKDIPEESELATNPPDLGTYEIIPEGLICKFFSFL